MSFRIKRNDLSPAIEVTLEVPEGTPLDLTGCTVRFYMKLQGATSPKVDAAATVSDAAAGEVAYDWSGDDTDTAGLYRAEFEVTFPGGATRTFPTDDYLYVNVVADLG